MTFNPINIVDGKTVDLFEYRLEKSVQQTCAHPDKIMHNAGLEDDGSWYRAYHCESCGKDWIEEERYI